VLPGRHAYSHVNALSSAAKAYLVTGDGMFFEAARNGFQFVEEQTFATGAWGPDETFLPDTDRSCEYTVVLKKYGIDLRVLDNLGESVRLQPWHFETGCGTYAHFKITRYLLRITQEPGYGDSMERIMYNCALGVLPLTRHGDTFYNASYSKYATKQYFDGIAHEVRTEWPCCSGTLPMLAADYGISTYFIDAHGAFINLYLPSTFRWNHGGTEVTLTQSGEYPLSDSVFFEVGTLRPVRLSLRFRIPAWSHKPELHVNGSALPRHQVNPGSFVAVTRTWRTGDRIELVLRKTLELKPVDDSHPDLVALVCGPLVLFAIGNDLPKLDREVLLAARQTEPSGAEWRSGIVRFLPWWRIDREVYSTYHDVGQAGHV
jgi:hypothetical protein